MADLVETASSAVVYYQTHEEREKVKYILPQVDENTEVEMFMLTVTKQ